MSDLVDGIAYFDTAAFIPLVIAEPPGELCQRLWQRRRCCRHESIAFRGSGSGARASSPNASAHRTTSPHRADSPERLWAGFDIVEADDIVIRRVGQSAEACALRGHGAVHCAFAEQLRDTDLVVACGDRTLVKTCLGLGIATAATNRTD